MAVGVGKVGGPGLPNVMESRMVTSTRTAPAKVADLTPPKVHPSNIKPTPPASNELRAVAKADQAVLQYRDNLVKRFPKLSKAELKPIARNLGEPGLWEESVYTGSGRNSWSAKLRDGRGLQLDDIDQAGVVVDTKMRGIGVGRETPPMVFLMSLAKWAAVEREGELTRRSLKESRQNCSGSLSSRRRMD